MARTRNPGLLHCAPALLIGVTMLTIGVSLLVTGSFPTVVGAGRSSIFRLPPWLVIAILIAIGAAVTTFGMLSVRQTWREVRNRPTRQQWLGY